MPILINQKTHARAKRYERLVKAHKAQYHTSESETGPAPSPAKEEGSVVNSTTKTTPTKRRTKKDIGASSRTGTSNELGQGSKTATGSGSGPHGRKRKTLFQRGSTRAADYVELPGTVQKENDEEYDTCGYRGDEDTTTGGSGDNLRNPFEDPMNEHASPYASP